MSVACIYGAGQMGMAVKDFLAANGIEIHYFLDKNKKLEGSKMENITVIHPDNLPKEWREHDDVIVGMAAAAFTDVKEYLVDLGYRNVWIAGDYIQNLYPQESFTNIWAFSEDEAADVKKNLKRIWNDKKSEECIDIAVDWFEERREDWARTYLIERNKYFPDFVIDSLRSGDAMIDMAVLDGGYVRQFVDCVPDSKAIWGVTLFPDGRLTEIRFEANSTFCFEELELGAKTECIDQMRLGLMRPFTSREKVKCHLVSAKDFFEGKTFNYLRAYSMSPLLPIMKNGIEHIQKNRPIVAANIGHYKDDFIFLPQYFKENLKEYTFYFRVHSFQGNDCIMYAIPNERRVANGEYQIH